ncbi:MAG TPA: arginase family protein [Candidatus Binatia bacterium]
MAQYVDRNWPTAADWIAGAHSARPVGTVGLIGAPLCKAAITPGRYDLAPSSLRSALAKFATFDLRSGHDVRDLAIRDFGDLDVAGLLPEEAADTIAQAVENARRGVDVLMILGGDNSITRPGCLGIGAPLSECALLTLDAHFDLRDLTPGPTNGNPIRCLLAAGLPGVNISQIGIQSFANSHAYAQVARDAGIEVITIEEVRERGAVNAVSGALSRLASIAPQIYVDVDIDVLDRGFAPACPGSRPGGLLPFELLAAVRCCGSHPQVVAADFVEVDPTKDVAQTTVYTAASCVMSFAAGYRMRLSS